MFQFVTRNSYFVILMLLLVWGCHKKPAAPAPVPTRSAPPPAVTPPATIPPKPAPLEPAPLAKTVTAPTNLDLGEMSFQLGNYSQAIRLLETFLQENPKSGNRDKALFYLGFARFLAGDPDRDPRQAEAALKRLLSEHPNSQYRDPAQFILGLNTQIEKLRSDIKDRDEKIKRLSEELQKLKEIDLQRRPSRPPE